MTPVKILVVEDDRVVARDIAQQLVRIGHSVVGTTAVGEEALPLVLETRPDLVLMDYHLDQTSGLDAIEWLRHNLGGHLPAALVTADRSPAVRTLAAMMLREMATSPPAEPGISASISASSLIRLRAIAAISDSSSSILSFFSARLSASLSSIAGSRSTISS